MMADKKLRRAKSLPDKAFSIPINLLAQLIAAHTSGVQNAIPENEDMELANKFIKMIDERYED